MLSEGKYLGFRITYRDDLPEKIPFIFHSSSLYASSKSKVEFTGVSLCFTENSIIHDPNILTFRFQVGKRESEYFPLWDFFSSYDFTHYDDSLIELHRSIRCDNLHMKKRFAKRKVFTSRIPFFDRRIRKFPEILDSFSLDSPSQSKVQATEIFLRGAEDTTIFDPDVFVLRLEE